MGDIIKFVAGALIVLLLLVFVIPLLWLVVKLFGWIFGGLFGGVIFLGGGLIWILILIVSVVAIIALLSS